MANNSTGLETDIMPTSSKLVINQILIKTVVVNYYWVYLSSVIEPSQIDI